MQSAQANKQRSQTVSGLADFVLPGGKHTGSSQYDVYSLDGMAMVGGVRMEKRVKEEGECGEELEMRVLDVSGRTILAV